MAKHLYRTVEKLLDRIDDAFGDERMLVDLLNLLVTSEETVSFGVVSGRLYKERERDFKLIESIGEHGAAIAGKTVSKDYQVVKDIQRLRLSVASPDSPGWDPQVESQFSDEDSTAIIVGKDPAYIISLSIRHTGNDNDLMVLLGSIRGAVSPKLREAALADKLRQAQIIQHSLLPAELPTLDGFEIAAVSHAAEEVGGDVYDVQKVESGVVGLLLADASGHGLPAALQARDVIIGMRMGQAEGEKINGTVSRLNRVIHRSTLTSRFISIFYGELEETGNMAYVNGGHCPPLLLTPAQEVFELQTCGPVLGPLPEAEYRRGYVTLHPGEVLLMFTDGVTECQPPGQGDDETTEPQEYGRDRLVDTVKKHMDLSAQDMADRIVEDVRAFGGGGPFADDVSLMVVKRLGSESYPPVESLTRLSADTRR